MNESLNCPDVGAEWRPFVAKLSTEAGTYFKAAGLAYGPFFVSEDRSALGDVPPVSISLLDSGEAVAFAKHGPAAFRIAEELADTYGDLFRGERDISDEEADRRSPTSSP
jgi:hypothetical protein